jgi:predicted hydrocarbon binding protein
MPTTTDLAGSALVALSRASLATLRASLLRDAGAAAFTYLQEAGYAGGPAVFGAFRRWLEAHRLPAPEQLGLGEFERQASAFFGEMGWGTLAVGTLGEAVATLDSPDWAEGDPSSALEVPGCHVTTGMFADFFGRVADAPLAVMEVECRSAGADRCRFLVGSPDVLGAVYEGMAEGRHYDEAASGL